jgi:hypothetical protein
MFIINISLAFHITITAAAAAVAAALFAPKVDSSDFQISRQAEAAPC